MAHCPLVTGNIRPMKLDRLTRRLVHLREVADHIDRNLDTELRLEHLAEVAHLSRFHFDRVFSDYAGEAPLARVRRLRLMRARRKLENGQARGGLLDLALENGYTSAEAFSRAFRSQFGCAPSSIARCEAPQTPGLRIEYLPALTIQYLSYEGESSAAMHAFDELRARAMLQEVARDRRKGWSVELSRSADGQQVHLQAALLSEKLGTRISGLTHGTLPAGDYAVLPLQGSYEAPPTDQLAQRIAAETGWGLRDAPVLRCFHNPSYLPSAAEKRCELYVPVQR